MTPVRFIRFRVFVAINLGIRELRGRNRRFLTDGAVAGCARNSNCKLQISKVKVAAPCGASDERRVTIADWRTADW